MVESFATLMPPSASHVPPQSTAGYDSGPKVFIFNGVPIQYSIEGKGEPVVLIHGLFASARINWRISGIIKALAKDYQVIAMDVRGHGGSGKPKEDEAYGVEMMEDVVRLLDHLNIQKAHVVGYSMGGMITMKLLTRHPDRVRSAILGGMGWGFAKAVRCSSPDPSPRAGPGGNSSLLRS